MPLLKFQPSYVLEIFSPQLRLGVELEIRLINLLSLMYNTCTTRFNNKRRVLSKQLIYVYHMILTINNILSLYSFNNQRSKHTIFLHYMAVLVLPPLNTLSTCVTFINLFKLHLLKQILTISITRAVSANKLSDVQIIWHQLIATFQ